MTNNPYGGAGSTPNQPPTGGGPGGPSGPGGPQYGAGATGPNPGNGGQSALAKVFDASSDLPSGVRQLHMAALVSAAGYLVMQILNMIATNVMLSNYSDAFGLATLGGSGVAVGIFGLIIGLALYILVIVPLLGRQNWGRILGIVFAILGGLFGLFGLLGSFAYFTVSAGLGFVSLLQALVQVATAAWFLAFAFRAEVAAWYVPHSQYGYQQSWGGGPYAPGNNPQYGPGQTPPPGQDPGGYGAGPQGLGGPGQTPDGQSPQQGPPPSNPPH